VVSHSFWAGTAFGSNWLLHDSGFCCCHHPCGIYAQVAYGEQLANVDWLHGSAEFFLTLSNILVVLGFREAIIQHKRSSSS
jgi:hypothetical protein